MEPGLLQADGVDLNELRRMVSTLDRTTVRGKRDAAVLLVDWWMAGRASEPARLNLHDIHFTVVKVTDPATKKKTQRPALIVKIRRSKADQQARGQEVRILAPDDQELCPLFALREWMDVLADDGQLTPGPLLRRIDRHGTIGAKAAGRQTKDEKRRGGITADTVNDIVKTAARAAELTPAPTPEERAAEALAAREAKAAAAAAPTAEESDAILKAWRTARPAPRSAGSPDTPCAAAASRPCSTPGIRPKRSPSTPPLGTQYGLRRLPEEDAVLEREPHRRPRAGGLTLDRKGRVLV